MIANGAISGHRARAADVAGAVVAERVVAQLVHAGGVHGERDAAGGLVVEQRDQAEQREVQRQRDDERVDPGTRDDQAREPADRRAGEQPDHHPGVEPHAQLGVREAHHERRQRGHPSDREVHVAERQHAQLCEPDHEEDADVAQQRHDREPLVEERRLQRAEDHHQRRRHDDQAEPRVRPERQAAGRLGGCFGATGVRASGVDLGRRCFRGLRARGSPDVHATLRSSIASRSQSMPRPGRDGATAWPSTISTSPRVIARSCGMRST